MNVRTVTFGMGRINKKPTKYKSRACVVDGIKFPSQKEAHRYRDLKLLESQDLIRDLRVGVPFQLKIDGVKICRYVGDFCYSEYSHGSWHPITEDVKGYKGGAAYRIFRLKKKLMLALLGIAIRET